MDFNPFIIRTYQNLSYLDRIKLLMMVAMTVGHLAWAFVPTDTLLSELLHFFGRLTIPLACFLVAIGFRLSRNITGYARRLFGFGLLAQLPFVTPTSFLVSSLGVLLVAGFLVHYAMRELMGRFGLMMGAGMTVVGVLLLSAIPAKVVLMMLVMVSLVAVVVLSVFSGFGMKISHLRKTFNFKTENRYNIWRILVRLVVPLAVVLAMMGWVIEWLK